MKYIITLTTVNWLYTLSCGQTTDLHAESGWMSEGMFNKYPQVRPLEFDSYDDAEQFIMHGILMSAPWTIYQSHFNFGISQCTE